MKINTQLPFWAALLIVSPQTAAVIYALLTMKDEDDAPEVKHRRYEIESGLICGILLLMAGIRAASYFFFVYLYGLARVKHDHLRLTAMPNGSPWIVSNGDRISNGHFFPLSTYLPVTAGTAGELDTISEEIPYRSSYR
jgi:hypothetical protein